MRIFVCGPYTGPSAEQAHLNVCRAMTIATELMHRGHEPFLPHLSHYLHLHQVDREASLRYDRWMRWTLTWLDQCDALYFMGRSPGADAELARARELKMTIYRNLGEVPDGDL